jgi:predicted DNA-binding transcriptional regulator YafY
MDKYFTQSFGIFAGAPTHTAVLRFSQLAAKWVKDEEWFPDLKAEWLPDGQLELHIPYHNPTELIMEICRYGADVEVVEPPELRQQVLETLQKAAAQYT